MKKYFLALFFFCIAVLAFTQTKPKPPSTKMPSAQDFQKFSAKDMAEAWENESRLVPKRDNVRIAGIAKGVTDARLKNYVGAVHRKINGILDAELATTGEAVYAYLEKEGISREDRGNTAMGFWAAGNQQIALFVLGKVCADTPTPYNLNNYASMLTMMGGEQLAIPILENLITKIPDNIILLNNLGQAWFGLGDIDKAEKYLNNATAIYSHHPQATLTLADIAESKGQTSKAVELIRKSIQHAYTKEKQDKLHKLGYELKLKDLRIPFKPDGDPLVLSKYKRPPYPKSVAESITLKPVWEAFQEECNAELTKQQSALREVTEKYSADLQKLTSGNMQNPSSLNALASYMQVPIYMEKASLQMEERKTFFEGQLEKLSRDFLSLSEDLERIKKERKRCVPEAPCTCHRDAEGEFVRMYNERKQTFDEQHLSYFRQFCGEMVYWSQFTTTDDLQFEIIKLELLGTYLGKLASPEFQPEFAVYTYEDCKEEDEQKPFKLAEFDFSSACKYTAEIKFPFITQTINCSHTTTTYDAGFLKSIPILGMGVKNTIVEVGNEFERSTLVLTPKVGVSTELVPLPVEAGISVEGTVTINTDKTGKTDWTAVAKAGVELSAGKSIGPVKAKATVGEFVEMEFDKTGLKDVNLVTEAKVEVKVNAPGLDKDDPGNKSFNDNVDLVNKGINKVKVEIGMEDRASLMTGHGSLTVKGPGNLTPVIITQW